MKMQWAPFSVLFLVIVVLPIGVVHVCFLESPLIEWGLPVALLSTLGLWVLKTKNRRSAWIKTAAACMFSIALQSGYGGWIHSESFPERLLSARAQRVKESGRRMQAMEELSKQKNSLNQKLLPTVKTPVESGEQGTAAEL